MSKPKLVFFLAAIFLTTIISQHDAAIWPIAGALYELFPDQLFAVNWALSGPSLLFLFASLLVPILYKFMSRKKLLLVTCIVFGVSCICAVFVNNLYLLVLYRTIGGFCIGFQQVVAVDIISANFTDVKKRATFVGWYNAAQAIMGTILSLVCGFLAVRGWEQVYNAFWIIIPITILVIIFVPDSRDESGESKPKAGISPKGMGRHFWVSLGNLFFFCVSYAGPLLFLAAVYVTENSLGNEAYAGLISSVGQFAAMFISLIFGLLYGKLGKRTGVVSCALMVIGLLGSYFAPNPTMFIVMSIIGGASYGMMMAYQYTHMLCIVPKDCATKAISFVTAVQATGFFVCTYIASAIGDLVGGITQSCLVFGIVVVILLVIEIVNTNSMVSITGGADEEVSEETAE